MSIDELNSYFNNIILPSQIQLNPGVKCTDPKGFIANHLYILNNKGLNIATQPFYDRLTDLVEYFEKQ